MKPLNPIMAVLVIASVGASPLRTLAADGANSVPAATADDKNPLNALAKILTENASARTDAGKRMESFLLEPDANGKKFVADDTDPVALGAVAREWAEKAPVGDVSVLYFVAGPGLATPGWAAKDSVLSKTFVSGMKWEGRLRAALADWTGKSQIDKRREKSQVSAFLNDAAAKARTVFSDSRTKDEIDLSIEGNNNSGPVVPDTRRSPGSRLDGATRQYTLNDLYGAPYAVVKDVSGPGDPHSRKISMKIYTKRLPDGSIVNEIGIFDITDTNDIYGQRFRIDSGDQSFTLDDRTAGHKKYELKFGQADDKGNRTITFARPGEGGAALTTSVSELFTKRADQAAAMGNIVNIGGKDFYTLPQGGAKSSLALFPKDVIDAREGGGDPRSLVPSLFAEVGKRGSDGRNEHLSGKPHLGAVGDKEFHLEFNKTLGAWEVKEGAGDPPPAPPTTGDGSNPGGSNPGGSNPGGSNPGGGTPEGGVSIADLENLLLKSPECKKNPDDTKDLASGLKGKYGIIACNSPIDGLQQIILVPKSASTPGQQLRYGNVPGFKLLRARFYDHYLVLQFDKQVQYLDLLKQDQDGGKDSGFALSGFVADKNASKFGDSMAFVDAIKNYIPGVPSGAFTEVPKRVAAALGNKPYNLTGAYAKEVFVVNVTSGGETFMVWPEVKKPGAAPDATPNPYTSLSGPANAMDGAVTSVDEKFPDKIDLPESRQAKAVKVQADIALYESVDLNDKPEPKKHFVMFRYKAQDGAEAKVFRQKPFEVFNAANPYPGDALQLQGLTGGPVVKDRVASGYKFVSGSTRERGVLAVFQNKQVTATNAKDGAANCVGPVIWWGLKDRDAALKVCQDDKF